MTARSRARRLPTPRLRGLAVCLGALAALVCTSTATAADGQKLVVVLYPDASDGAPGIIATNRVLRETFATQSPTPIEVRNEYVDTSRPRDAAFMRAQVSLIRQKYHGRKVDLVITGLSAALDFALAHRDELFPGVPIVFVAVDERELKDRRLPRDVIGVPIRMDLTGTLDLALRFHPDTRRVFVVAGSAPYDAEWADEARRVFARYEDRREFVYLTGLPTDELHARVAALPERSVVYYLHIRADPSGRPTIPAEELERLAARANAPVYGHIDSYVGRGIVGGRVFSFEAQGRNAAAMALRVLAGEKFEAIAIPQASTNIDTFDWRQLRRWGISDSSLPPDSVVRHRQTSFWNVYKWHIAGGVAFCLLQAVLIAGLLVQLAKRRRAEGRFRQVIETAPTGVLLVGRDGTVVMVNAQMERLFGYTRNELLGRPVEALIPERMWGRQPDGRERFFAAPEVWLAGAGGELYGRRKDGSAFPVEIGLSPLRTPRGLFALASVIDLTERRRAEDGLRASQRELRLLTGRLLEAQEVERRRIARELHDDVNQELALLGIEMELLAEVPGPPAQVADRVRELADRLKDVSSSVHDLSHRLHPSKLEHLGLVAAIDGLRKELRHSHGLDVGFTHHPDPGPLPQDVALCLYRIVQEALRNVVRHSGSRYASVELTVADDVVRLRIADDGRGFDPGAAGYGLGLISMRERLNLMVGEIVIDSRPCGGTRIDVRVPLHPSGKPATGVSPRAPEVHGVPVATVSTETVP